MMYVDRYRGHELVACQEAGGWRVRISDTGLRTGLHSAAGGAFAEARRYIDTLAAPRRW
jgi:hypothetical protein